MTIDTVLLAHSRGRTEFKPADWVNGLDARKREKLDFHSIDREMDDPEVLETQEEQHRFANRKFYSVSASSELYVAQWMRAQVKDKVFLDYACGNGNAAIRTARMGARLCVGLDISDVSVVNARRAAAAAGVSERCFFVQGDCEATELPDNSINVVLCSGMLHHLDMTRAYLELARILRPDGRLLAVEALGHNPVIELYRD